MFCHLHVRTGFSFLFGTFTPEALVETASKLNMKAVAITDRMGLYGAIRFYLCATKTFIKPVIGAEVWLPDNSILVLLAKDFSGYNNLCKLLTEANLKNRGIVNFEILSHYRNGILCLTGGKEGRLWNLIALKRIREAERFCLKLRDIFKENLFIELQNHRVKGDKEICEALYCLSKKLKIQPLATNSVTFLRKEDYCIHKALVGIQKVIHHRDVHPVSSAEFYLKTETEMKEIIPFEEAVENAGDVSDSISLWLPIGKIHPPAKGGFHELSRLCFKRLCKKYRPVSLDVMRRLDRELSLIKEKGFSSYFLIVNDIFQFAKSCGIRCSVRGSAAGSLVSYLLFGGVDPLRHNLLFERFLNEGRFDPPDIDLDFDSEKREEVMQYVLEKYRGKAALVATVPTFRARSAIREIARVLGHSYKEIDKLTQFIPYHLLPSDIPQAIEILPELKGSPLKTKTKLLYFASKLDGLPRQLSVHLGGIVICEDLTGLVPLQLSPRGYPLSQYDKDDLEKLGLTKFDILGLRMHTAIAKTLEVLRHRGIELDIDSIPLNDRKTYALLCSTDTVGVFQVESPGQRQLLGRLQPHSFSEIIAEISLFRPGPMQANMIDPYVKRKHKQEKITYIHPRLTRVLRETYGVLIFQEQVLRIVHELTGLGYDWADDFRRSMTKDKGEKEMKKLKERFISACLKNGIDREVAEQAYKQISAFAAYGFCKAHAASFAHITYQSAYLKAHYPLEFYVGLLNAGHVGSYPARVILNEARRKFPVYPPHVNYSEFFYKIEGNGIRVPLSVIKGIGARFIERIVNEREKHGLFHSVIEFKMRTKLPKNAFFALLNAGAFEGLHHEERAFLLCA